MEVTKSRSHESQSHRSATLRAISRQDDGESEGSQEEEEEDWDHWDDWDLLNPLNINRICREKQQ